MKIHNNIRISEIFIRQTCHRIYWSSEVICGFLPISFTTGYTPEESKKASK